MKSFDLSNEDHSEFNMATTDSGLCQVLNGDTMKATFAATSRMRELWSALEKPKTDLKPHMIEGAGKGYQKVFWLDLGDKQVFRHNVQWKIIIYQIIDDGAGHSEA